jgi:hypothetical protein
MELCTMFHRDVVTKQSQSRKPMYLRCAQQDPRGRIGDGAGSARRIRSPEPREDWQPVKRGEFNDGQKSTDISHLV